MDETVDLAVLTHDDKCRYWDDEDICDCGAVDYELLTRCRIERDRYKSVLEWIANEANTGESGDSRVMRDAAAEALKP